MNAELVRHGWDGLNKEAASGVDGVTAEVYAANREGNITDLAERVKAGRYRAKLVRRVYIPKENGKARPLGIPALEDKLVQLACAKRLGAMQRLKDWIKGHRHLPGREFIRGLNRRRVGHYHDYGLRGNSRDLWRFFQTAVECAFKWLNRRGGKRKSFSWQAFNRALQRLNIAKPRITEKPVARRVFA